MDNEKKRRPRIVKPSDNPLEERTNHNEGGDFSEHEPNFERNDRPENDRAQSFDRRPNFGRDERPPFERKPWQDRNQGGGYERKPWQDRSQ
ncbi:MAG: hypothetical protein ACK4Q5_21005, partial [Saprospiraceae bacterium]